MKHPLEYLEKLEEQYIKKLHELRELQIKTENQRSECIEKNASIVELYSNLINEFANAKFTQKIYIDELEIHTSKIPNEIKRYDDFITRLYEASTIVNLQLLELQESKELLLEKMNKAMD
jgi:hypothetical protein